MRSKLGLILALLLAGLCVVAAGWASSHPSFQELLSSWTSRPQAGGLVGMTSFALLAGIAVVFFFPGSVLMTASGAAFGPIGGFVTAQVGASLGAALAFFVSRYLARRRVESWMKSRPSFAAVDDAIGSEGWKIVVLTRFCPLFPYIFQNYAYGLTRVRFRDYALGSFVGIVPATLLFAYLGALGRSGAEAAAGEGSALTIGLRVLGLAATLAVTVYVGRVSRRALARAGVALEGSPAIVDEMPVGEAVSRSK